MADKVDLVIRDGIIADGSGGEPFLGDVAIQGNLNPEILLTDPETVSKETEKILRLANGRPGHIFNLGHGILPQTPMENVHAMIETVKNWKNP